MKAIGLEQYNADNLHPACAAYRAGTGSKAEAIKAVKAIAKRKLQLLREQQAKEAK